MKLIIKLELANKVRKSSNKSSHYIFVVQGIKADRYIYALAISRMLAKTSRLA